MNAIVEQAKSKVEKFRLRHAILRHWISYGPEPEVPDYAIAFMSPIDQVCAEPAPRYARSTLYCIAALAMLLLLIGLIVKVDIVVVGTGRLQTSTPPLFLQPVERAIIRTINVRPGDHVRKGEVLAILDPTFAQAGLGSLAAQRDSLVAQRSRVEAELAGKAFVAGPNAGMEEKLQATLFEQRQGQYLSRLKVFSEEKARLTASIGAEEQDSTLLASQLGVAREVEDMRLSLLKSQNGSRLNYLESQSLRMRNERDYHDSQSRLVDVKLKIQSQQAEEEAFREDWRRQLLESRATLETQLNVLGTEISKAALIQDFVQVTAPADGVILDAAQRSVGSILHEAEPLFTLIPDDATLVADIAISSADIGSVKTGDKVLLKIDAFPYNRHGMAQGSLRFVSEESFASNSLTGQTNANRGDEGFHRGQVALTDSTLRNLPQGARLFPGMTLQAEIKVGSRSIVGYILSPVTRGLGEAMREP